MVYHQLVIGQGVYEYEAKEEVQSGLGGKFSCFDRPTAEVSGVW